MLRLNSIFAILGSILNWNIGKLEMFGIAGNNDISFDSYCCKILKRIFEVWIFRVERLLYFSLGSRSYADYFVNCLR